MARRPPDRSVLEEIRKLRANLAPHQFQPLHNGLGLGRLRPSVSKRPAVPPAETMVQDKLPPLPAEALQAPPLSTKPTSVVAEVASPFAETKAVKPQKMTKPRGRSFHRLSMWGIDCFVVILTLLAGLMAIELYAGAGRAALVAKNLPRTLPFMVARELGPLRTILGLSIVLLLYWLFFRLFAGGTPGEFLVGKRGAGKADNA